MIFYCPLSILKLKNEVGVYLHYIVLQIHTYFCFYFISVMMACCSQILLPTVDLFTSELESVGPKWYDLGVFLGISTHELDVIGKYHGSEGTQRCLIELFKCFQSSTKPVSWNDITDALTKIHNIYLADQIHNKYVRTVSSPPHSENSEIGSDSQEMEIVSHSQPLTQHETKMETGRVSEIYDNKRIYVDKSISREFSEIIISFAKLVLEIKRALRKNQIPLDHLQRVILGILNLEPISKEEATLDAVLIRLHQHYCFLNYHILAYLVDMFLSNEKPLQQLLVDYTNKLEKFKESVMMKDLMRLIKEERDLCGNHKIIQLKTHDFWGTVTLNKFERLVKLIFQNLYDCTAQIRIKDGCICFSWVIPDIDTSVLDTVSPDLLKVVGVISLKIDDKVLYEGPNEGCHILESAFLQAVELGNVSAVELLLAVGCDTSLHMPTGELAINSAMKLRDSEGMTIFHLACLNGHTDVVHILLAAGVSPELKTSNLMTPLMIASQNGHNEVVELLLKAKVDPNAYLNDETTAISIDQKSHCVVVTILLKSGANPSFDTWTPLTIAGGKSPTEVVTT